MQRKYIHTSPCPNFGIYMLYIAREIYFLVRPACLPPGMPLKNSASSLCRKKVKKSVSLQEPTNEHPSLKSMTPPTNHNHDDDGALFGEHTFLPTTEQSGGTVHTQTPQLPINIYCIIRDTYFIWKSHTHNIPVPIFYLLLNSGLHLQ